MCCFKFSVSGIKKNTQEEKKLVEEEEGEKEEMKNKELSIPWETGFRCCKRRRISLTERWKMAFAVLTINLETNHCRTRVSHSFSHLTEWYEFFAKRHGNISFIPSSLFADPWVENNQCSLLLQQVTDRQSVSDEELRLEGFALFSLLSSWEEGPHSAN